MCNDIFRRDTFLTRGKKLYFAIFVFGKSNRMKRQCNAMTDSIVLLDSQNHVRSLSLYDN